MSGQDTSVDANLLTKHKSFLSVGHDEYWSKDQRANVTAARDAGVNLAFFGGNDVYWKTRWEPSQDGTNTANRTLVCFKDTWADTRIDPVEPTATWRDPRFGDNGFGPENSLIGTQYQSNFTDLAINVTRRKANCVCGATRVSRLWHPGRRPPSPHTPLATSPTKTLTTAVVPPASIRLSTTTGPTPQYLTDFGGQNSVVPGTTTHHLTQYRAASGALVFSAGTIQWAWGLDSNHDGYDVPPADPRMRQATANVLADMSAFPTTLAAGLVMPTKSGDTTGTHLDHHPTVGQREPGCR